jgi:CBS domain containing-hemolysin-like protein
VGEIQDEYDVEEKEVERGEDGCYNVRGRVEISKLNEDYGFELPEEEDINTIGGLVARLADRVPKSGESVNLGDVVFTVIKSDARKIERVRIDVKKEAKSAEAPQKEK